MAARVDPVKSARLRMRLRAAPRGLLREPRCANRAWTRAAIPHGEVGTRSLVRRARGRGGPSPARTAEFTSVRVPLRTDTAVST